MGKFTNITVVVFLSVSASAFASATDIKEWEQQRFEQLDTNNNQQLDRQEFRGTTEEWMTKAGFSEEKQIKQTNKKFNQFDSNNDDTISINEFVISTRNENQKKKSTQNKKAKSNKPTATAVSNQVTINSDQLLQFGDAAPNYLGTDKEGNEINVEELKGKIVIASFWVSWCKPCKQDLAILNNLQNQVGEDLVKVVGIAQNKESKLSFRKYREQLSEMNIALTHDKRGKIGKNYGVDKGPHMFVISKEGKIIFNQNDYKATPVKALLDVLKAEFSS